MGALNAGDDIPLPPGAHIVTGKNNIELFQNTYRLFARRTLSNNMLQRVQSFPGDMTLNDYNEFYNMKDQTRLRTILASLPPEELALRSRMMKAVLEELDDVFAARQFLHLPLEAAKIVAKEILGVSDDAIPFYRDPTTGRYKLRPEVAAEYPELVDASGDLIADDHINELVVADWLEIHGYIKGMERSIDINTSVAEIFQGHVQKKPTPTWFGILSSPTAIAGLIDNVTKITLHESQPWYYDNRVHFRDLLNHPFGEGFSPDELKFLDNSRIALEHAAASDTRPPADLFRKMATTLGWGPGTVPYDEFLNVLVETMYDLKEVPPELRIDPRAAYDPDPDRPDVFDSMAHKNQFALATAASLVDLGSQNSNVRLMNALLDNAGIPADRRSNKDIQQSPEMGPATQIPGWIGFPGEWDIDDRRGALIPGGGGRRCGYTVDEEGSPVLFIVTSAGDPEFEIRASVTYRRMDTENVTLWSTLFSHLKRVRWKPKNTMVVIESEGAAQFVLNPDDGSVEHWGFVGSLEKHPGIKTRANFVARSIGALIEAAEDMGAQEVDIIPVKPDDAGIRWWARKAFGMNNAKWRTHNYGGTKTGQKPKYREEDGMPHDSDADDQEIHKTIPLFWKGINFTMAQFADFQRRNPSRRLTAERPRQLAMLLTGRDPLELPVALNTIDRGASMTFTP